METSQSFIDLWRKNGRIAARQGYASIEKAWMREGFAAMTIMWNDEHAAKEAFKYFCEGWQQTYGFVWSVWRPK